VSCNITIFYPYRGGIANFKCIDINKASLSKLRVSFEYLFAGPSVLVFGNHNMVTLNNGEMEWSSVWTVGLIFLYF